MGARRNAAVQALETLRAQVQGMKAWWIQHSEYTKGGKGHRRGTGVRSSLCTVMFSGVTPPHSTFSGTQHPTPHAACYTRRLPH